MSHAITHYEVHLYQYVRHIEAFEGKEGKFHTEWNNSSVTLLAECGEEDVALLTAEALAVKLDADRTLAVWAHGNTFNVTIRVTKVQDGFPSMILRLSSYRDNAKGELVRTEPRSESWEAAEATAFSEVPPNFEDVKF